MTYPDPAEHWDSLDDDEKYAWRERGRRRREAGLRKIAPAEVRAGTTVSWFYREWLIGSDWYMSSDYQGGVEPCCDLVAPDGTLRVSGISIDQLRVPK